MWAARSVLHLTTGPEATAAVESAEGWLRGEVDEQECLDAAYAADAYASTAASVASNAASVASNAASAASDAAAAAAANATADDAVSTADDAAAYAAHAATGAAAYADLVAYLTGLIDEYDRLIGRATPQPLTESDTRRLATHLSHADPAAIRG